MVITERGVDIGENGIYLGSILEKVAEVKFFVDKSEMLWSNEVTCSIDAQFCNTAESAMPPDRLTQRGIASLHLSAIISYCRCCPPHLTTSPRLLASLSLLLLLLLIRSILTWDYLLFAIYPVLAPSPRLCFTRSHRSISSDLPPPALNCPSPSNLGGTIATVSTTLSFWIRSQIYRDFLASNNY